MRSLRNRLARTAFATLALGAAGAATLTTTAAPASADVNCAADCILNDINPHSIRGVEIATSAQTTVPTTVTVKISKNLWDLDAQPIAYTSGAGAGKKTNHYLPISGLTPGTNYFFRVFATDAAGNVRKELGFVHTADREVTININKITVIDDSDSSGAGEFAVDLRVGEQVAVNFHDDISISSGESINPNWTRTEMGGSVPAMVELTDDDDDCWVVCLDTSGTLPSWGQGSNSDADWATAKYYSNAYAGEPEFSNKVVEFSTPANAPVKFKVLAAVKVKYYGYKG
ncbi:NDNF family protein [Motilibacter deserti]|uniref:NDNF family protein n=1 Tax=Motilibacter deserti TaxID=2714956 RepID=A0ABX0GSF8_9ACTN|nr:NDNF family protein [Motilibacter deserti]NHC12647.1 NDNF family protein [Motilibacter deserti]